MRNLQDYTTYFEFLLVQYVVKHEKSHHRLLINTASSKSELKGGFSLSCNFKWRTNMFHLAFELAFAVHTNGTQVFSCSCACVIPIHSERNALKFPLSCSHMYFFFCVCFVPAVHACEMKTSHFTRESTTNTKKNVIPSA